MTGRRWMVLFLATAGIAAANTLKTFDGPIFSGVPMTLTNQLAGDGLDFSCSPSCGFTVQSYTQGGLIVPSGPNYVNLSGNSSAQFVITFTNQVDDVAFQTLGIQANGGGYLDGANVKFLDGAGNTIGTSLNGASTQNLWSIAPISSSSTTVGVQNYFFTSSSDIHQLVFTKTYGLQGGGYFGFDSFVFGTPEPGTVVLASAGLFLLGVLRRRPASKK